MTNDAILVVRCIFQTIWQFFTQWHVPGTNVTPAEWAFFSLCVALVYRRVVAYIFNSPHIADIVDHQRTSNESDRVEARLSEVRRNNDWFHYNDIWKR